MNALAAHILSNRPARAAHPPLVPAEGAELTTARAHEVCGPARRYLAFLAAAASRGPIFWIAPAWCRVRPNPPGFAHLFDPGRLTLVSPTRVEDVLWTLEEVLRSGAVPLVVADLPDPPGLTPIRRLHLAAETGAAEGAHVPTALILTPDGDAPGVESRWALSPACDPVRTAWRIERLRARQAPPKTWEIDATGRTLAPAQGVARSR